MDGSRSAYVAQALFAWGHLEHAGERTIYLNPVSQPPLRTLWVADARAGAGQGEQGMMMNLIPPFVGVPEMNRVYNVDAMTLLKALPDSCIDCCVTSPPYFGLRSYLEANDPNKKLEIGLEKTPAEYVQTLVTLFHELRRVLKDSGTFWLNLGDGYVTSNSGKVADPFAKSGLGKGSLRTQTEARRNHANRIQPQYNLPEKNLLLIPHRVAIALQDDGWIVRQDNVWCLSGGSWVYVKTQKGEMPMMIRDMARLRTETVKLWNGSQWTQLLGWSKTPRKGTELEFTLRSGERIACTPNHKFPTNRGLLEASKIAIGDILQTTCLPEPSQPIQAGAIPIDAAWFLGLYLAEGSRSNDSIQIAGHTKEIDRFERVQRVACFYGGNATVSNNGNNQSIRVSGKLLNSLIDTYISGQTAHDKGLTVRCWMHSNEWLKSLLDGYLSGDGHWDDKNQRWRLGFTRNYNLERDLRILAARLGAQITIKLSEAWIGEKCFKTFRGELRFNRTGHPNEKSMGEIVSIRKSKCREVYDIGVEDEPHLFALASGVLTHNSKPNPMPESVTDRTTRAHEYVFQLVKSGKYYYDAEAVKEPAKYWGERDRTNGKYHNEGTGLRPHTGLKGDKHAGQGRIEYTGKWNGDTSGEQQAVVVINETRNKRSVWTISPAQFREAHFATFPPDIPEICIRAGCPPSGVVLDPFMGSGTVALVARAEGRQFIGSELSAEYMAIINKRLALPYTPPLFEMG